MVSVSVLFNEPKLLKSVLADAPELHGFRFSALQRAEIAEINIRSAAVPVTERFSALQRAEIAEMYSITTVNHHLLRVSVLFNEPKLLK